MQQANRAGCYHYSRKATVKQAIVRYAKTRHKATGAAASQERYNVINVPLHQFAKVNASHVRQCSLCKTLAKWRPRLFAANSTSQ